MIETRATVVLSMAHLHENTVLDLRARPLESWYLLGAPVGPDMILMHVHTENAGVGADEIPPDIWACMVWANQRVMPFDYILFDRDVDPAEDGSGLPDYSTDSALAAQVNWRDPLEIAKDAVNVLRDLLPAHLRKTDEVLADLGARIRVAEIEAAKAFSIPPGGLR
jgi:hypothetical protein